MSTIEARFLQKVRRTASCWIWEGARTKSRDGRGYGNFWNGSRSVGAHRWSYENFVGPVPATLHLDHLCVDTLCVNPDHLEPVTIRENVTRGFDLRRAPCGTAAGYQAHRRRSESCDLCRVAWAAYARTTYAARRAARVAHVAALRSALLKGRDQ